MFIGMLLRSSLKPACISAEIERAWARAACEDGHRPASGLRSLRYSAIDSDSQIARPRCTITGTLPEGECFLIEVTVSGRSSGTMTSSNSIPAFLTISQPRSDQDE